MKLLAVLLCTAALSGCSLFSSKKKTEAAPVPAAAPAAAPAATAAAPAAKKDGAGFLPPGESGNVAIDGIVVVVNDDVITQRELDNRIRTVTARMKAQNVQMPDPADLRRQLLERMIVERSQLQLAKEMGVRVDDLQLDRAIQRIAEAQKLSVQDLRNQMEKDGTPFASFREEIREEIIMQRLREHEVDGKIQISDAEVDSFVAAEKAAAAEQFEINISQIMVRIPDNATAEVIAQRRARAEEVMRQLRTGADFAKMAATYSDASDALQGGVVGWRQPERLPPIFAEALSKLKPGQVTPIIKSTGAFHILKAVDRRSLADAQAVAAVQQTHARHILIKVTPTMSAADAKRKLLELKERLDNNAAKFEDLARLVSNDGSASKGGDLGWLMPGDTMPEFEAAMNNLKIGEVSEPVETSFGIHLIQVLERKTDDVSKERERTNARQALRDRKLEEATESWQREVRDRAYVEYRNDDDKAANSAANK
ncbi:molecular chaperone SurA [Pseudoduganella sp. FT25W]|uniref:Chaperone SurA n=1 Tax=Duganella alba TaxID=2666081 RepID=A0A6L5QKM8_9BURK|nr:peptidylprolyl isomerase [Duganella alba]MRX10363.1 molecular chaperone SurA [Duganella alba]MRX17884.1 molecular chaperone SurA [Duganella alba]